MKQTINIQIEVEYGSEFQSGVHFKSLTLMLQAWRIYVKGAHKKNKVIATLNGNPIQDIPA
jgi:hypothetical protein